MEDQMREEWKERTWMKRVEEGRNGCGRIVEGNRKWNGIRRTDDKNSIMVSVFKR